MSREHVLERTQRVALSLEETFEFFSDAYNLETITPPWLGFRILTPRPIEMRPGALIEYRLRLHGIPIRWRTRIEEWEPPHRFVDLQVKGPYELWHHTHTFEQDGASTLIGDRVRYRIGFGALGEVARRALVTRDVEQIFDFRGEAISRYVESRSSSSR